MEKRTLKMPPFDPLPHSAALLMHEIFHAETCTSDHVKDMAVIMKHYPQSVLALKATGEWISKNKALIIEIMNGPNGYRVFDDPERVLRIFPAKGGV